LYTQSLDYQRLKVFGCLCYPLLHPYGHHKLEYRSKPYIFLGYQYAGYKCLNHVTNKAYFPCHVVFDETYFPVMDHAASLLPSHLAASSNTALPFSLSTSSFSHDNTLPSAVASSLPVSLPDFNPSVDIAASSLAASLQHLASSPLLPSMAPSPPSPYINESPSPMTTCRPQFPTLCLWLHPLTPLSTPHDHYPYPAFIFPF
jgi:hypothetical protein